MTVEELADWMTYDRIEPIGTVALEELFANQTVSIVASKLQEQNIYPFSHRDLDEVREMEEELREANGEPSPEEIRTKAYAQALIDAEKLKREYAERNNGERR